MTEPSGETSTGTELAVPVSSWHRIGRDGQRLSGNYRGRQAIAHARRNAALRLRSQGRTFDEIAAELEYNDRSAARKAVNAALADITETTIDQLRQEMADQIAELYRVVIGVMESEHLVVDKGVVVHHNGEPLKDDGPKLAAVGQARQLLERMSKLLGADAPQRTQLEVARVDFTLDGIPASEV